MPAGPFLRYPVWTDLASTRLQVVVRPRSKYSLENKVVFFSKDNFNFQPQFEYQHILFENRRTKQLKNENVQFGNVVPVHQGSCGSDT